MKDIAEKLERGGTPLVEKPPTAGELLAQANALIACAQALITAPKRKR